MGSRSKLTPSRPARTHAVCVYAQPGTVAQPSWAMPIWPAEPFDVRRSARDPAGHIPLPESSVTAETEPAASLSRNVPECHEPEPMDGSTPPRVIEPASAGVETSMQRTSIQSPLAVGGPVGAVDVDVPGAV